jgi:hypothetical protein
MAQHFAGSENKEDFFYISVKQQYISSQNYLQLSLDSENQSVLSRELKTEQVIVCFIVCAREVSVSILSSVTSYTDRISRVSLGYPNEFRYSGFKQVIIPPFQILAYPLHNAFPISEDS